MAKICEGARGMAGPRMACGPGGAHAVSGAAAGGFSLGTAAVGALAVGAVAIGALAIGRLAIRRLRVDAGSFGRLHIEDLEVDRLRITTLLQDDGASIDGAVGTDGVNGVG